VASFTPVSGLIGRLLIELAVTLLLNGRIAGISSIVGGLLTPKSGDTPWRVAFIVGLLFGALAFILALEGQTYPSSKMRSEAEIGSSSLL
jgi:uncharacterized protein